jgi:hypothetical protein
MVYANQKARTSLSLNHRKPAAGTRMTARKTKVEAGVPRPRAVSQ